MPLPMLSILRQLRQDLARQLAPQTIRAVCQALGHTWRACPLKVVSQDS